MTSNRRSYATVSASLAQEATDTLPGLPVHSAVNTSIGVMTRAALRRWQRLSRISYRHFEFPRIELYIQEEGSEPEQLLFIWKGALDQDCPDIVVQWDKNRQYEKFLMWTIEHIYTWNIMTAATTARRS